MKNKEKRTITFQSLEVETRADEPTKLVGHAAVFDEVADLRWFSEKIAPGAFRDSIKTDDIRALWNHDTNYVMGRNSAGTLSLKEDDKGLRVEITPPNTETMRGFMNSVERGDVDQMSFGFQTLKEEWDETNPDMPVRTLKAVKLFEVSPVTFPAYEGTDIAARSLEAVRKEKKPTGSGTQVKRKRLELKKKKVFIQPHKSTISGGTK